MLQKVICAKCIGIDAVPVTVEVDIRSGIGIHLVGLCDTAVKESLLRTVNALQSHGFKIPGKKIVISLAPADLHKSGSCYDLPIAVGIVAASEQRELPLLGEYLIMGELGLNGEVRDINGALSFAELSWKMGLRGCILPERSALEASELDKVISMDNRTSQDGTASEVYGVRSFDEVLSILGGKDDSSRFLVRNTEEFKRNEQRKKSEDDNRDYMDFSEIVGQEGAKRGAEIAAAGGHNMILVGSPGSGKSSIAKAMAGILPPMTGEESVQTTKIYSVAGRVNSGVGLIRKRPFRAPHYSASLPALIGGGSDNIMPGEMSLAHNGLLFCDEFCEAPKKMIEALRAPMEDRKVIISRLKVKVEYPASFMLVAATNPCPCGYYGEGDRCNCTVARREAYLSKLSGPIMDRIDIQLWLHNVDAVKIVQRQAAEPSSAIAERVRMARERQKVRFRNETITTNAQMDNRMIARYCPLDDNCKAYLEKIVTNMGLSARACSRIIKLARTIADVEGEKDISLSHLAEAASYRFLDRQNM